VLALVLDPDETHGSNKSREMKFGKQLVLKQSEGWRESYIHYKQLVHLLKDLARLVTPEGKAPEYAEAEKQFIAAIEAEVVRVNAAYLVHEEQVNQELKTLREKYREKKSALTPDSLSVLRNDVLVCSQSIFYLQEFGGLNATGFQKLIKKTEKLLGKANVPWAKGLKAVYSTKDFYLSKKPAKFNQIATVRSLPPSSRSSFLGGVEFFPIFLTLSGVRCGPCGCARVWGRCWHITTENPAGQRAG
jgi:hypothetical protein